MPSQNDLRSIDEIPLPYQSIFSQYPCFNVVQSAVLDQALNTVSPIKALCQERLVDWHKKLSCFGVNCISVTSDNDEVDPRALLQYNIIISTPEKWDVLTRRWKENNKLIDAVSLFLIDEVHLLNADSRGSTLEVIVSRMKTARGSYLFNGNAKGIRFIALSATIPNIEDIAEWMGQSEPAKYFQFSEEVRPVKLNKIVLGYNFNPQVQSVFKFDMSLSYKISGLISKHSEGKPTLIFCNTRKSVEMTANHLVKNLQIRLSHEQKEILMKISQNIADVKLRQNIVHGIAFHHAGLIPNTRHTIEESFKTGQIPVLVTTSTLAMGVNLPAHLVIVKCTKCYSDGGYKDYDEVSIFQMIGRAGRSQFDTSATVLILTSLQDKIKYEQMLSCSQIIESNLHKHLTEHLNAEVVLRTITDLEVAMRWLSSTFLYVRARKSPEKYKLPAGLSKDKIDKKLLEMCQIDLNKLVATGMIRMNQAIEVTPTVIGEIMAKYYVAFETMKLFTQVNSIPLYTVR
uniref:DNA 3'-5' helicase n=1 Tax=Dendroctonus ponderosae TaxID=77166 RepID=A0AAR5PU90_DENPD